MRRYHCGRVQQKVTKKSLKSDFFYFKSLKFVVKTIKKLTAIVNPANNFVYQGNWPIMHTINASANNISKDTFFTMEISFKHVSLYKKSQVLQ